MKARPISEAPRKAILDATWDLVAARGQLDVAQGEIAAKAGISRHTVHLAFAGRASLLVATPGNKDASLPQLVRPVALRRRQERGAVRVHRLCRGLAGLSPLDLSRRHPA